jgi:heat shock protein HslJ
MRLAFIAVSMSLAACASEDRASPSPGLNGKTWIAESIDGKAVAPPGAVTLTIDAGTASGNSGCNTYSGRATVKDREIKLDNLASTLMACMDDARMQQEGAYQTLLRQAARLEQPDADRLEIVAGDGRRIVFTAKN